MPGYLLTSPPTFRRRFYLLAPMSFVAIVHRRHPLVHTAMLAVFPYITPRPPRPAKSINRHDSDILSDKSLQNSRALCGVAFTSVQRSSSRMVNSKRRIKDPGDDECRRLRIIPCGAVACAPDGNATMLLNSILVYGVRWRRGAQESAMVIYLCASGEGI